MPISPLRSNTTYATCLAPRNSTALWPWSRYFRRSMYAFEDNKMDTFTPTWVKFVSAPADHVKTGVCPSMADSLNSHSFNFQPTAIRCFRAMPNLRIFPGTHGPMSSDGHTIGCFLRLGKTRANQRTISVLMTCKLTNQFGQHGQQQQPKQCPDCNKYLANV